MTIFGLVIMTKKKYNAIRQTQTEKILELMTKIGSLEYDKKHLQEKLKDAEIRNEQLEEMNDGLWEMRGVEVDAERDERQTIPQPFGQLPLHKGALRTIGDRPYDGE